MDIYEDKLFEGMVKLHECTVKISTISGLPYIDRLTDGFHALRAEYGMNNICRNFHFKEEPDEDYWVVLISQLNNSLSENFKMINISTGLALVFYNNFPVTLIRTFGTRGSRFINIRGCPKVTEEIFATTEKLFNKDVIKFYNTYFNSEKNNICTSSMTIECKDPSEIAPIEHYPYLDKEPAQFANDFMESRCNVVLLVGPPGTGKSTYLRAVSNAFYNVERDIYIMNSDQVLNSANLDEFIKATAKGSIFIIEDADRLVGKRSDGNAQMSMLLNQIDGIVVSDKKFIISTNLASINKVDEALIRPGRCYSVLNFRKLYHAEANLIYKQHYNVNDDLPFTGDLSLAEVLNYNTDVEQKKRVTTFGFNQ